MQAKGSSTFLLVYTLQVVAAWITAIPLVYTHGVVLPPASTHWAVYTHWRVGNRAAPIAGCTHWPVTLANAPTSRMHLQGGAIEGSTHVAKGEKSQ